jgi:hypothetical protein
VLKLVRLYLSSFKLGNETQELVRVLSANRRTAYVSNAMDCMTDLSRKERFDDLGWPRSA